MIYFWNYQIIVLSKIILLNFSRNMYWEIKTLRGTRTVLSYILFIREINTIKRILIIIADSQKMHVLLQIKICRQPISENIYLASRLFCIFQWYFHLLFYFDNGDISAEHKPRTYLGIYLSRRHARKRVLTTSKDITLIILVSFLLIISTSFIASITFSLAGIYFKILRTEHVN